MNITNVKKTLPMLLKHKIVAFLHGTQGIGKTQTVKQIARDLGYQFVHLHTATQEVGDLVGLLVKDPDGTVRHARPEWFPTSGKGIVFLDELNRAHPDVLQALFSFITEGTIHRHVLPPDWRIVAAGNYGDEFNVTDTSDAAWISRFCHIDFRPETAEFVDYAETKGCDKVAAFVRDNPTLMEPRSKSSFDKNILTPDPRSMLEKIGALESEDLGENEFEVLSGCIGVAAASAYIAHKKKHEKSVSLNTILARYETVRDAVLGSVNKEVAEGGKKNSETRFDLLNAPVEELFVKLSRNPELLADETKLANLQRFLIDLPLELSMKVFNWAKDKQFTNKKQLVNNKEFLQRLL